MFISKYCFAACISYICGRFFVQILASAPAIVQLSVSGLLSVSLYIFLLYFLDIEILLSILEMVGIRNILERLQKKRNYFSKEDLVQ